MPDMTPMSFAASVALHARLVTSLSFFLSLNNVNIFSKKKTPDIHYRCRKVTTLASLLTCKINNNGLSDFERGKDFLQNDILNSVYRQESHKKVRIYGDEKPTFLNGAWHLKG